MPTYEYSCQNCQHQFEQLQAITVKPLKKCPQCGKLKLARLIGSGAGIIFKGSGFYQTDYRSESYNKSSKAQSPSSSPADNKNKPESKETAQNTTQPESPKQDTVKQKGGGKNA